LWANLPDSDPSLPREAPCDFSRAVTVNPLFLLSHILELFMEVLALSSELLEKIQDKGE
jgi:hypothetical protein